MEQKANKGILRTILKRIGQLILTVVVKTCDS